MDMNVSNTKLPFWLQIVKIPGLGPAGIFRLLRKVEDISELYQREPSFYKSIGAPAIASYFISPDMRAIEQDLAWLEANSNHTILTITCTDYPQQLLATTNPPVILYVKGNSAILNNLQIALVGSRKPSPEGREIAFEIARQLATFGLCVTSGLATGIDTAAHLGALIHQRTIAVIGTGIDITYPLANHELAERIAQKGAIVSELNLGAPPLAEHFPRRNRIISGLSVATCIIEANEQSGSLITANFAAEQGREVFAIPGSIRNPRTRGCHKLIKSGAGLITSADDILIELGLKQTIIADNTPQKSGCSHFELEEVHLKLLECVGYEPAKIDVLVGRSNIPVKVLTSLLMDLELAGYICCNYGGYRRVS